MLSRGRRSAGLKRTLSHREPIDGASVMSHRGDDADIAWTRRLAAGSSADF
jgi:hypothetical protein